MEAPMNCPACQEEFTGHRNLDDPTLAPRVGDVGMCVECGVIYVFTEAGLVEPNAAALAVLMRDPKIQMLRAAWLELQRKIARGDVRNE